MRGEHAWNVYKRQQQARGERLDPAALVPPPVPDEQNFASTPYLAPLFDYLPGTQQPRDTNAVNRGKALSLRYDAASSRLEPRKMPRSNSWVVAEIDLPGWYTAFLKGTNAAASVSEAIRARYGLTPRQPEATSAKPSTMNSQLSTNRAESAAGVLAALAESEQVLEELRAARQRPYSRFNLCYTNDNPATILMPHYAILKRLCQILQLRASAELVVGRTEQAFEDIDFIFRLTDAIRDEPLLIAQLVRIAELQIGLQPLAEGLTGHQWSEPQLRAFEQRLLQFDFFADGRLALEGERAFLGGAFIDYVRRSPNRNGGVGNERKSSFSWQDPCCWRRPRAVGSSSRNSATAACSRLPPAHH